MCKKYGKKLNKHMKDKNLSIKYTLANRRRGSSIVAYQAVVLQSRVRIWHLPSPQLTANLLVGCHLKMALGCGLTSVRGNRGKNYKNEPLVPQKHTKKKKL
jgi:hypothetical protein